MKIFFSLLLIVNIAFGITQWLMPYEQLFEERPEIVVAEELRLLDGPQESEVITETEAITKNDDNVLVAVKATNQLLCYTIGPFKDKTRALEISGRYSSSQIETRLKSSLEKDYMGVMVYIGGHKNRKSALKTARSLAAKGIRDYIIVKVEEEENVLSIGVFGLKKNADRLIGRLKKLKFPVKSMSRYRERTIYWLYYQQTNDRELLSLLDDGDIDIGISQISRQCS